MKRRIVTGITVFAGLMLLGASAAPASQKGINACAKAVEKNTNKFTSKANGLLTACTQAAQKCLEKALVDQPACIAALNVVGAKCSPDKLDPNNPLSKLGKAYGKLQTGIDKKCDPAIVNDPAKLTLTELLTVDLSSVPNSLRRQGNQALQYAFVGGPCGTILTYPQWAQCLYWWQWRLIITSRPRFWWWNWWWWHFFGYHLTIPFPSGPGLPILGVPIGQHVVAGSTNATLTTYLGPIPLFGIGTNFTLDIGSVDPLTGAADITVDSTSASFSSVFIPIAGGITVCVDQPTDGQGKLCCAAAGCPALGSPNYSVNQDHDSSGNNAPFFLFPGAVGPPDPACTASASNSVATLPATTTTACLEDKARSGACNNTALGDKNPNSHAPRCLGGGRNGQFCDPLTPVDCPGAGGCPGGGGCCSQSPAVGPILAPPCNGPATLIPAAGAFADGNMALSTSIQFTLHSHVLDAINYQGTCPVGTNCAGDGIPDGWGADGVACTGDDTTPPGDAATLALTVGVTSSSVFNTNLIPSGFGGVITTGAVVGATPANACLLLSSSVTAGYNLAGAFPGLDNSQLGDTVTSINELW